MNTRLQQFIAAENISQAQFADSLNVARAGISHILAGRNKPSYDFLTSLISRYPKLNIEWLMFGKGKMYKEENVEKNQEQIFQEDLFSPQQEFSMPQDTVEEFIEPSDTFNTIGSATKLIENQRKVKKIIILFDDNTYQEL